GLGRQRYGFREAARFQIDRRKRRGERIYDEELPAVRGNVETGEGALFELLAERDALLLLEVPGLPEKHVECVVVAGRRVETFSVGTPGEPEPAVAGLQRLPHEHVFEVDDRERRCRVAVTEDHGAAAIGRLQNRERQRAHADVAAGGIDAPAVG